MVDRFFPIGPQAAAKHGAGNQGNFGDRDGDRRASAKIRSKGVADDDEDYELPVYAERIPVRTVLGAPEPCPRLLDGVERPASLAGYSEGRLLEDALRDAHFAALRGRLRSG